MYQRPGKNKQEKIDKHVAKEKKYQEANDVSSVIGNEAAYQYVFGDNSGNDQENDKEKSVLKRAKSVAEPVLKDIKDIGLPQKVKKDAEELINIDFENKKFGEGDIDNFLHFADELEDDSLNQSNDAIYGGRPGNNGDGGSQNSRIDANDSLIREKEPESINQPPVKKSKFQQYMEEKLNKHPAQKQAIDFLNKYRKGEPFNEYEEESNDPKDLLSKEEKIEKANNFFVKEIKFVDDDDSLLQQRGVEDADEDMQSVKNFDFAAQRMDAAEGTSWWTGVRNKVTSFFSNVLGFIFSGFGLGWGIGKWRRSSIAQKKAEISDRIQEKRDRSIIPGWGGQKFDPNAYSGNEINADFRRVPTVWSKLIADKAAEGEGEDAEPLPPTISIYIDQPKNNSSQAMSVNNMGHSMIGIEYSRFSGMSKRYERYSLKYGFYPAINSIPTSYSMKKYNATVPGELQNDAGHDYTVSRRYSATARQVNDVLKASETYADGGYGYLSRNCTTFVRDMADIAHLPVSNNVFEKEEVDLSDLANFAMVIGGTPGSNLLADTEEKMISLSDRKDESYANFGNKRVTRKDFENFSQSLENDADEGKTYIPGSVGEKLRRETTGEIGSQHYKGKITDTDDIEKIKEEVNRHANDLRELIVKQLLGKNDDSLDDLPDDLAGIIRQLPYLSGFFDKIIDKHKNNSLPTLKEIQLARRALTLEISSLNKLYYQHLGEDRRLHNPVMNLISLINLGINFLDNDYEKVREKEVTKDNLGNLPEKMNKENVIEMDGRKVKMSPSYYEAYLQIYKSPREAINAYIRYAELDNMGNNGYSWFWHPTDKKEYERAKRIHNLAGEFIKAHRYMLEKENYNESDVEYAFMQYNRESQDGASGDMLKPENVTAGTAYITMILDKVFGGIRENLKSYAGRELGEDGPQADAILMQWVDNEMYDSLSSNKDQMLVIFRGLRNSMKTATKPKVEQDDMLGKFRDAIDIWSTKVFSQGKNEINQYIEERMQLYFMQILDGSSDHKKSLNKINELITQVLQED